MKLSYIYNFSFQDRKLKGLLSLNTTADQQQFFSIMRRNSPRPQSVYKVAYHLSQCVLNDLLEASTQMMVDFFKIKSGL